MLKIGDFVNYCKKNGLAIEKYEISNSFKEKSHISVLDIPNGLRIDLRGVYTEWDKGVVETAEQFNYEGTTLRIAKPEFLIPNKLFKGGEVDIEDAFSVFVQNQKTIDKQLLENISKKLGVQESLQHLYSKVKEIITKVE
jgi:hypothetical protein